MKPQQRNFETAGQISNHSPRWSAGARRRLVLGALTSLALATTVACGGGSDSAGDEDSVSLKFSGIVPDTNVVAIDFFLPFVEYAEQMAKDKGHTLSIQRFPDAQLGSASDQVDTLNSGVADMGPVSSSYSGAQMPLSDVFNLPRLASSGQVVTSAYYAETQDQESEIYKVDFEKNDLVPVGVWAFRPYQIVSTQADISLQSIQGKPVRAAGAVQQDVVETLGATPVQLSVSEQYQGLQQGTVDAGLFNLPATLTNSIHEVTNSFTVNANVSNFNGAIAVSKGSWDELPEWAQEVLIEAGQKATEEWGAKIDETSKNATDTLIEEGLTAIEFDSEQSAALDKALKPVERNWVEGVTSKGMDGETVLKQAKAEIDSVQ